jgi:DNA mismatch repair ATPase MutS
VIEERFLESNQYNYLLSIFPSKQEKIGLAWVDISVGEFVMQETTLEALKDDLARIRPREVVLPESRFKSYSDFNARPRDKQYQPKGSKTDSLITY